MLVARRDKCLHGDSAGRRGDRVGGGVGCHGDSDGTHARNIAKLERGAVPTTGNGHGSGSDRHRRGDGWGKGEVRRRHGGAEEHRNVFASSAVHRSRGGKDGLVGSRNEEQHLRCDRVKVLALAAERVGKSHNAGGSGCGQSEVAGGVARHEHDRAGRDRGGGSRSSNVDSEITAFGHRRRESQVNHLAGGRLEALALVDTNNALHQNGEDPGVDILVGLVTGQTPAELCGSDLVLRSIRLDADGLLHLSRLESDTSRVGEDASSRDAAGLRE
mmetsp:Transcript_31241/g.73300  ORF Transcript_31241/g.73300 Transcript_31241/m.73300 type:complete len:273 (-) Transcript_31241:3217-4035(-)